MKVYVLCLFFCIVTTAILWGEVESVSNIDGLEILISKTKTQYCCTVSLDYDKVFTNSSCEWAEVEVKQKTAEGRTITTQFTVTKEGGKSQGLTIWFPTTDVWKYSFQLNLYSGRATWKTAVLSDLIHGKKIPSPFEF